MAGLSVPRFTASDSVPPPGPFGASPLYSPAKANISWFFCRLSLMSCAAYLPLPSTPCRSPEVSSTAFRTQPPDLQPVPLMDMDFVVSCQLVRHRMPQIRCLYIGSYVCSTLLSDPASRRRPCASLSLHLHQVVKRTFIFELS